MAEKVELTAAELKAVRRILGNTMDYPDQLHSMFDTKRERLVACRAYVKLGGPDRSSDVDYEPGR